MGRIGEAVARRLIPFGIRRVLYWGRSEKPQLDLPNAEFSASLDKLLAESDYVVVCCALTPETKNLFRYEKFSKMKSTAIFVNTARGGVVQQDDLGKSSSFPFVCLYLPRLRLSHSVRALEERLIAAAGLDVTTPEPLPPTNRLYQLPNCIIVPHIGNPFLY